MAYFDTYQEAPVKFNLVPREGRYYCKVNEITYSKPEEQTRYTRVDLIINSEGYPHVSLFLTEGNNFNGNLTAFYDTFGIQRGNNDPESWKGHYGYLDITFKMKDGFKNMVPHYILDEHGYVIRPQNSQQQAAPVQTPAVPQPAAAPQQPWKPLTAQSVAESFGGTAEQLPEDIPF